MHAYIAFQNDYWMAKLIDTIKEKIDGTSMNLIVPEDPYSNEPVTVQNINTPEDHEIMREINDLHEDFVNVFFEEDEEDYEGYDPEEDNDDH